jgi:hypothetical protein
VRRQNVNASVFTVTAGQCSTDYFGCLLSPGYPTDQYGNEGSCVVAVNQETVGPLQVSHFDTETSYDVLVVNGMRFSGSLGPENVVPFEDIVWHADYSAARTGWRICSGSHSQPSWVQNRVGVFNVTEGLCTTDDTGCVMSPNYPNPYNTSARCTIGVQPENTLRITVNDFLTETRIDQLEVNGLQYSGVYGPDGVVPTAPITWTSDGSIAMAGWKLCPTLPTPRSFARAGAGGVGVFSKASLLVLIVLFGVRL